MPYLLSDDTAQKLGTLLDNLTTLKAIVNAWENGDVVQKIVAGTGMQIEEQGGGSVTIGVDGTDCGAGTSVPA